MKLTFRLQTLLPLALAFVAAVSVMALWTFAIPALDQQLDRLQRHQTELKNRKLAASQAVYQSLLARLQQPLPQPDAFVELLQKQAAALDLPNISYTVAQPKDLILGNLHVQQRKISLSIPASQPAAALMLWQELRSALPCEVRLASFTAESSTRLELELIGAD